MTRIRNFIKDTFKSQIVMSKSWMYFKMAAMCFSSKLKELERIKKERQYLDLLK